MRSSLIAAATLALSLPASAQLRPRDSSAVDLLIRGGTVLDGSGGPGRIADVGVRGDRIAFVGDAATAGVHATRTLDARGLIVSPGFIDPHTHTADDLSSPARHGNVAYLMQGVTTVITGNDGGGPVDVAARRAQWDRAGIGTNAALLVGFGTARERVLGQSDAAATPAQLATMRALVDSAMRGGAVGLSSGLYYAPQSYAPTEEVIELAKVAARYGGIYDTHLRDESSYSIGLYGAVAEALRVGRQAGIPVNISHIKALGTDVWGASDSVVRMIRRAQADGLKVTADQYPYTASGSSVGASLLPRWAEAGGRAALAARAANPETRARLVTDMETNLRRRGGAASLLITGSRDSTLAGRTLEQVARARGKSPVETAIDIVLAGDASVASFNMQEADIERFMREPWVMTGSDGSSGHPRKYGTFPRKLREYVLTRHILTLPEFVHRSAALPAEVLHLADRGVLRRGAYADIAVFDTATVRDLATYEEPQRLATGMRWVLVNGVLAVDGGQLTQALAGRALTRAPREEH